jgi:hypothetical protein
VAVTVTKNRKLLSKNIFDFLGIFFPIFRVTKQTIARLLFTIFKELKKIENLFFVTIAAIFHKRPGLATISLKVDHI